MKVEAVHADVVVATSRIYQTTCTLIRRGQEAFCVDSPILPDELELLPTVAQQSDFHVVALLATHADWDHLLARYAFPDAPLGVAESTASFLDEHPGAAQRGLRGFDDEHYVARPGPLALGTAQRLPVPGRLGLGDAELELHPLGGHTPDGMALVAPWARVLVTGDHLSPIEIPIVGESVEAYLATLDRLEALLGTVDTVVPGHGEPLDAERALAILREDRDYLQALAEHGAQAPLPLARRTGRQRELHEANAGLVAG